MKKIIIVLLASALFSVSNAQKMATVNSNEIVMSMPETKALQKQIQEKSAELSKQLEAKYKEYQTKAKKLEGLNPQKLSAIEQNEVAEVQDLEKRIQQFEQTAQKEVQEMEQKLSIPILEKAKKVIEEVAKERGFSHVFDVATGGLVVYPKGDDLTDACKTKMGIPLTPATPAATGGKK